MTRPRNRCLGRSRYERQPVPLQGTGMHTKQLSIIITHSANLIRNIFMNHHGVTITIYVLCTVSDLILQTAKYYEN